jgi:hypothetical protein
MVDSVQNSCVVELEKTVERLEGTLTDLTVCLLSGEKQVRACHPEA